MSDQAREATRPAPLCTITDRTPHCDERGRPNKHAIQPGRGSACPMLTDSLERSLGSCQSKLTPGIPKQIGGGWMRGVTLLHGTAYKRMEARATKAKPPSRRPRY